MKDHMKINGKLLQINKRFSQLKSNQKDWIATELYKLYHDKMKERCTTRMLPPVHRDMVISSLYEQIQNKEIWIPYSEVKKYTVSKTTKIVKSFIKQFPELSDEVEANRASK